MTDYQSAIAEAVAERGYREGWTDEQFVCRQAAKLLEEFGEFLEYVWPTGNRQHAGTWEDHAVIAGQLAREHFDNGDFSKADITDREAAAEELADMLVVVYNAAEALGVDVNELALRKARGDIERGVRE